MKIYPKPLATLIFWTRTPRLALKALSGCFHFPGSKAYGGSISIWPGKIKHPEKLSEVNGTSTYPASENAGVPYRCDSNWLRSFRYSLLTMGSCWKISNLHNMTYRMMLTSKHHLHDLQILRCEQKLLLSEWPYKSIMPHVERTCVLTLSLRMTCTARHGIFDPPCGKMKITL